MFTKAEVKHFVIKFGNRWFFPNFHNKVTWFVISLGGGVVVAPTPLKLVFYNWLVDTININSGNYFTLAEVGSNNADYWIGFWLIALALLHNLSSKWLLNQEYLTKTKEVEKLIDVDRNLFKEFLEIFSSESKSAYLLENHDFGNSFSLKSLDNIDQFVREWNTPEKEFKSLALEELRKELWDISNQFDLLISLKSAPSYGGMQSVVPEQHKDDWDWPERVSKDVKSVNDMASLLFKKHQEFIREARKELMC